MGDYPWAQLKRYAESIEERIARDIEEIPLGPEDRKRLEEDPFAELELGFSHEEYRERTATFPEVLRRSAFVTCWIVLEDSLNELATEVGTLCGAKFRVSELTGRGVRRSVTYISRLLDLSKADLVGWTEILRMNEMRNHIVHKNGLIEVGREEALRSYITAHPMLDLVRPSVLPDSDVIQIGEGFSSLAVEVTHNLWKELETSVGEKRKGDAV